MLNPVILSCLGWPNLIFAAYSYSCWSEPAPLCTSPKITRSGLYYPSPLMVGSICVFHPTIFSDQTSSYSRWYQPFFIIVITIPSINGIRPSWIMISDHSTIKTTDIYFMIHDFRPWKTINTTSYLSIYFLSLLVLFKSYTFPWSSPEATAGILYQATGSFGVGVAELARAGLQQGFGVRHLGKVWSLES